MDLELRGAAFAPSSMGPPPVVDAQGIQRNTLEVATGWLSRVSNLREAERGLRRLVDLERQTKDALATVVDTQDDIADATKQLKTMRTDLIAVKAERGQLELASQFRKLSISERVASWVFRLLTFAGLGAAVAVALQAQRDAANWTEVLGHLAVAVAVGSAAAYMARLASAHGSTADWAKGVQVQLLTFQDFLNAIEDPAVKHRVYEEFGRRVLGPPPGKGDETAPLPTSQLLELANVIAAARKTS